MATLKNAVRPSRAKEKSVRLDYGEMTIYSTRYITRVRDLNKYDCCDYNAVQNKHIFVTVVMAKPLIKNTSNATFGHSTIWNIASSARPSHSECKPNRDIDTQKTEEA